jgi:hypothetical protein
MGVIFGDDPLFDYSKPQIHFSNLDALWRCGQYFKFRHIEHVFSMPPSAIHVGHAVDAAANLNLSHKIATDALLPVEHVLDIARDVTREAFDRSGVTPGPDEPKDPAAICDQAVDKAVRMADKHARHLAPTLNPIAVQHEFTIVIPGFRYDLVGTRDLDEADGTVHDLKTSKRSPKRDAAWTSDQGTLYTMAKWIEEGQPEKPMRFALDTIIETPRRHDVKLVQLADYRREADFQTMANRIEVSAAFLTKAAEKDIFLPARQTDWWCSETYCPYTTRCKYFRRPVSVAVGDVA